MTINPCVPANSVPANNISTAERSLLRVTFAAAVITAIVIGVITHWSILGNRIGGALIMGTPSVVLLGICINSCRSNRARGDPCIVEEGVPRIRERDMMSLKIIKGVPGGKELTDVERFGKNRVPDLPLEFNEKLESLRSYFESRVAGRPQINTILVSQPPEDEKKPVAERLAAALIDEMFTVLQFHACPDPDETHMFVWVYPLFLSIYETATQQGDHMLYFVVVDNIEAIFDPSFELSDNEIIEEGTQKIAELLRQKMVSLDLVHPNANHGQIYNSIEGWQGIIEGARNRINNIYQTREIIRKLSGLPSVILVGNTLRKEECLRRVGDGLFQLQLDI